MDLPVGNTVGSANGLKRQFGPGCHTFDGPTSCSVTYQTSNASVGIWYSICGASLVMFVVLNATRCGYTPSSVSLIASCMRMFGNAGEFVTSALTLWETAVLPSRPRPFTPPMTVTRPDVWSTDFTK